jgi:hypothetical protein
VNVKLEVALYCKRNRGRPILNTDIDKRTLSERDICTKFITPGLHKAGWDEMLQIREEVSFTKGRIIAHGNLQFRSDGRGEIAAVEIENFKRGIRTWGVMMTVRDMKTLQEKFVALVEDIERDARQPKRTA